MKDLIFRNLHGLKHEILKKSRRVIFFRFLYFPYVSKGSKNTTEHPYPSQDLNPEPLGYKALNIKALKSFI